MKRFLLLALTAGLTTGLLSYCANRYGDRWEALQACWDWERKVSPPPLDAYMASCEWDEENRRFLGKEFNVIRKRFHY